MLKFGVAALCGLGLAASWLVAMLGIIDLKNARASLVVALAMLFLGCIGAVSSAYFGVSTLLPRKRLAGGIAALLPLIASAAAASVASPGNTGLAVIVGLAAGGFLALIAVSVLRERKS